MSSMKNEELKNVGKEKIKNDELEEEADDTIDTPDAFKSVSDLEQEKQILLEKKFQVEGNRAVTQIFIQSLETLNTSASPCPSTSSINTCDKLYNLKCRSECIEFVEHYQNSEYLIFAIILGTFEMVGSGDLSLLKNSLQEFLPLHETLDKDSTQVRVSYNPYISLDTILHVIGGRHFVTDDGRQCIGFGDDSENILMNLWELFPMLRSAIISWLLRLNDDHPCNTAFDAYQIATAFSRIISLDIIDAKTKIFLPLYSNPNNAGLLGSIAYRLYQNISLREEMDKIVLAWARSKRFWLWRPAVLVYSFLEDGSNLEIPLKRALEKRLTSMEKADFNFISAVLMKKPRIRTLFADVFYRAYRAASSKEEKQTIAQTYVRFVNNGYYRVCSSRQALPLVACDTKQQQEFLAPLLVQVMVVYSTREQLYLILHAYLEEISRYSVSTELRAHLCAYFYNLTRAGSSYCQDVLWFLKKCNNEVANQIYTQLVSHLTSNNRRLSGREDGLSL